MTAATAFYLLTLPVNSNGGQRVCNKKDESELT